MRLSVVTTIYKSEDHLAEFCRRAAAAAEEHADDYEIVLVNDGCPRGSLEVARELAAADHRIKVIDLARNYRHLRAIVTGLAYASGDEVFLLDCDLEEPPEILADFRAARDRTGADVVYGVQESRRGSPITRASGWAYYTVLERLAEADIPRNLVTARLMSRRYVRALLAHQEREVYLGGLFAITGFSQVSVPVDKGDRGESSYSFRDRLVEALNGVTAFSNKPLVLVFWVGVTIVALAMPFLVYVVVRAILGQEVTGWSSLMLSIWIVGGLVITQLGIVAVYLSKIFVEVKARPYTIVRETMNVDRPPPVVDSSWPAAPVPRTIDLRNGSSVRHEPVDDVGGEPLDAGIDA